MKRTANWEARLTDVFESYRSKPWAWGESDCAHFAGDCVQAITGEDVLGPFRGNYATRLEAWARVRFCKHKTLEATVAGIFAARNCPEGDPVFAMPGDVGLTSDGALCVRFPRGFIARREDGQFVKVRAVRAWHVAWPGVE